MLGYFSTKRKTKMDIQKKLYWLIGAGVTCFCAESPVFLKSSKQPSVALDESTVATTQAASFAIQATTLGALNTEKQNFKLSSLKKTATNTLLGTGPQKPKLMCILDMPDSAADRSGDSLFGPQAEQLKKMMTAIHLDPLKDVYITYLCPWRTPGNRALTEAERALFIPFLAQEIQLVQPQKLLLFGATLSQALIKINTLSKARGAWHTWEGFPVRVTLTLGALKTTPLRQQAWSDLQEVEKALSAT